MYEKKFLRDVAYQHFANYDVQYRLKTPVIVSKLWIFYSYLAHWWKTQQHLCK